MRRKGGMIKEIWLGREEKAQELGGFAKLKKNSKNQK